MDAKESFSDGDEAAGDLIEEVCDYMTRKRYPVGCTEGRKPSIRRKAAKVCCEGWGAILQEEAERQGQLSGNEA